MFLFIGGSFDDIVGISKKVSMLHAQCNDENFEVQANVFGFYVLKTLMHLSERISMRLPNTYEERGRSIKKTSLETSSSFTEYFNIILNLYRDHVFLFISSSFHCNTTEFL